MKKKDARLKRTGCTKKRGFPTIACFPTEVKRNATCLQAGKPAFERRRCSVAQQSAEDALLGRSALVKVTRATKWHVEAELQ